jgi:hypothetical protein
LLFSLSIFAISTLILASITLYQVTVLPVPPTLPVGVASSACDDSNACTLDLLVNDYGHSSCLTRALPNGSPCSNSCLESSTCAAGECTGVCKGYCDLDAFDCPIIHAVNLTALGFGRDGADEIKLVKTCLMTTCIYTVDLHVENTTLSDVGVVPEIEKVITLISIVVDNNTIPMTFESADFDFVKIACLGFISEIDRDCIKPIALEMTLAGDELDLICTYAFRCVSPPSYPGMIEFPVSVA